jgi:hypothetical protein
MTRRGSLIYYLSAWILGCFFMTVLVWVKEMDGVAEGLYRIRSTLGLVLFSFYGFILGATTALLGGFLLRRIMTAMKCKTPWHWAIAGAMVSPGLVALLGTLSRHLNGQGMPRLELISMCLYGAEMVLDASWWLAIPAGAATGYFLGRIERAFAPQPQVQPTT